jgi:hypothetical protein
LTSGIRLSANTGRNLRCRQAASVVCGLLSLVFGFVLGLVFLGGLRQRLYERWIGVELGAGASPLPLLAMLAPVSLDALQLGDA